MLSSLFSTVLLLVFRSGYSYYYNGTKDQFIYWRYDERRDSYRNNPNDTFYLPLDVFALDASDCRVEVKNNLDLVPRTYSMSFPDNPANILSPVLVHNSTTNISLPIYAQNDTRYFMMEYRVVKYSPQAAYELAVYLEKSSGAVSVQYRELNLYTPSFKSIKIASQYAGTVSLYISRDLSINFEVVNETVIGGQRVNFMMSYFNRTASNQFRKLFLFNFVTANMTQDSIRSLLYEIELVPLGSFGNQVNRQFIVYRRGTSSAFLITVIGSLAKNNQLTSEIFDLGLNISSLKYVEGEFIMIEVDVTYTDILGKPVYHSATYYVRHDFGRRVEMAQLLKPMFLSRGRLANQMVSPDHSTMLYEFITPDLDGVEDEVPISTMYFSKTDESFMLYIEEQTVNRQGKPYVNGSYFRVVTGTHVVEIYKRTDSPGKAYQLAATNRRTGRDLGERMLPVESPVLRVHYLRGENFIIIKYAAENATDNHTQMLVIQDSFLQIKLQPIPVNTNASTTNTTRRVLQFDYSHNTNQPLSYVVICKVPGTSTEKDVFRINNFLSVESKDYFNLLERGQSLSLVEGNLSTFSQPMAMPEVYPGGRDVGINFKSIISGSFIEARVESEGKQLDDNHFFKQDTYPIKLESGHIAMPVYFEVRENKKVSRVVIMDMKSKTTYYSYKGDNFVAVRDAADSRNISNVEMLNSSDVYINISKNIFAINVESLKEKPLTGLGSFCKNVENVRIANLNEILLCQTDNSIDAHYTHEKFKAEQTKLFIKQTEMTDLLRQGHTIEKMLYSKYFPNNVFLLTMTKHPSRVERTYFLHIFELSVDMDISLKKVHSATLWALTTYYRDLMINPEVTYAEMIDNCVFFAMSTNVQLLYQLKPNTNSIESNKIEVSFMRWYNLTEHFKPMKFTPQGSQTETEVGYKIRVVKYETIRLSESSIQVKKSDRIIIKRVVMQLEITKMEANPKKIHNVVVFDHHSSNYDAYIPIFHSDKCKALFMGPAFFSEGDRQEKSLVFMCIPELKEVGTDKAMTATMTLFNGYERRLFFSHNNRLQSILDFSSNLTNRTAGGKPSEQIKNYKVSFYKTKYIFDLKNISAPEARSPNVIKYGILTKPFNVNFRETYLQFSKKPTAFETLSVTTANQYLLFGLLRRKSMTSISKPVTDYFQGHVFNTKIECESFIECRDGIINSAAQVKEVKILSKFKITDVSRYSLTNKQGTIFMNDKSMINVAADGSRTEIELDGLLSNCSDSEFTQGFSISLCLHTNGSNYFRLLEINEQARWFDIKMQLPSQRQIKVKDIFIRIQGDYMSIFTFNIFFKRYLTVFLFRIVRNSSITVNDTRRFFNNALRPEIGLLLIAETPMNDEYVSFLSLNRPDSELVYLVSLRQFNVSTFYLRLDGFLLNKTLNTSRKAVEDRRFMLTFESNSQYLLADPLVIPADDEGDGFIDVIIHFPNSQDYLFRIDSSSVEKATNNTMSLDNIKVLAISNPFFGVKVWSVVPPSYFNNTYVVPVNYYSKYSFLRYYRITPTIKNNAIQVKGNISTTSSDVFVFSLVQRPKYILFADSTCALFEDGEFSNITVRDTFDVWTNDHSLASSKIKVVAQGPASTDSVEITFKSKPTDGHDLLTSVVQILVTAFFGLFMILLVLFWREREQKAKPEETATSGVVAENEALTSTKLIDDETNRLEAEAVENKIRATAANEDDGYSEEHSSSEEEIREEKNKLLQSKIEI